MAILGARPSAIREAAARPTPRLVPSAPRPAGGAVFGGRLPTQPFAPAQRVAQQRVERATPRPTPPYIPRLPNPTPRQIQTAHEIALRYQRAQVGPNPTQPKVQAFQEQLGNTPEGRTYQQTVAHYLSHGQRITLGPGASEAKRLPPPQDIGLPLLGLADVKLPYSGKLAAGLSHALASIAPGITAAGPETGFMRNIGTDILSIGEFPLVAGYKGLESGVQASLGNPKPGEQFAKQTAESLAQGAIGQLVQGKPAGALRALKEHPVLTGTELLGGVGLLGRTAGAAGRVASGHVPIRPPLAMVNDAGTSLLQPRRFSPDATRAAIQRAADRRREPLRDAEGNVVLHTELGQRVPVLKATGGERERFQQKRANFQASRSQASEFHQRELVDKFLHHAISPGRTPAAAVKGAPLRDLADLVSRGRIRTAPLFKEDLAKEIAKTKARLATHAALVSKGEPGIYGTHEEVRAAKTNLRTLQRVAASPKLDQQIPGIVALGHALSGERARADAERVRLGIEPAQQSERAALGEYAVAHMGARHFTEKEHLAAERAAPTPQEAAAVSGRDPALLARHEEAKAARQDAQSALARATTDHRIARRERDSLVTLQRSHTMRGSAPGARPKTPKERATLDAAQQRVTQTAAALRDAKRTLNESRVPRKPSPQAALRTAEGKLLTNEAIREHAAAHGRDPATLAYAPHILGVGSKRAFHRAFRPGSRPSSVSSATRTYALQHRGSTAYGIDLARQDLTGRATAINAAQHFDQLVQEAGQRTPEGNYFRPQDAVETARRLKDAGHDYTPVRAFAAALPSDVRAALMDAQSPSALETAHGDMLRSRIVKKGDTGARNVLLVPKHLIDQHLKLSAPSNEFEKLVQLTVGPFRRAVLPQPRWLTGNAVEPYLVRLPLSGAGVNIPGLMVDVLAAHKIVKALKGGTPEMQKALHDIEAQQLQSGLFVGKQRAATTRRTYEDFTGRTRRALLAGHVIAQLPIVKQLGTLAVTITDGYFKINKALEATVQYQAFGRSVRADIRNFTGRWRDTVAIGKAAADEVARGLTGTATQQRYMEAQHELLGKYDGWGPAMKRLVRTYAPFLPWTLASLRFMYWTVPAHHTVAFAGLMKAGQAIIKEVEEEHAELRAAGIEGTISDSAVVNRGGRKGYVDWGRYTPGGITIPLAHGQFDAIPSNLIPYFSGAINALQGLDPFNRPLKVPKTPSNPKGEAGGSEKVQAAGNSLLESLVPLLSQVRRLREGGGTPYATSTILSPKVKPESSYESAFSRTYNPFRATVLKPKGGSGAGLDPLQAEELRELKAASKASSGLDPLQQEELEELRKAHR